MDRGKSRRANNALRRRPCLYNTTLKDYFNRNSKRKALEEIATTLATYSVAFIVAV